MTYNEKLDLIVKALQEAVEISGEDSHAKLYIDDTYGLNVLPLNQIYEILQKLISDDQLFVIREKPYKLRITRDQYEEIRAASETKQDEIKEKKEKLDQADKEYYITTAHLVELGSRSSDIFSRSKPHEKRALLNFVLSNRTLDNKKVRYTVKFPFSEVLKHAPSSNWLPLLNAFRNKKVELNIHLNELKNYAFLSIKSNISLNRTS